MSIVQQGVKFDRENHNHVLTSTLQFQSIQYVAPAHWEDYRAEVQQDAKKQLG